MLNYIRSNSWNRYSRRFVYAPRFTWEPVEGAERYRIGVAAASDRAAAWYDVAEPAFDFAPIWDQFPFERIDMLTIPVDSAGREVDKPWYEDNMARRTFIKSPGWRGGRRELAGGNGASSSNTHLLQRWEDTARRSLAYLLQPPRDRVEPFEEGLPRHVWSAIEDSYTGERHFGGVPGAMNSYPALHFPLYIAAFLEFADSFPYDPLVPVARRQAQQYGEWLLRYHHPDDWACAGFPFSCIAGGKLEEHSPTGKHNLSLFRAAAVGDVMLHLAVTFKDQRYFEYAQKIADGLLKFQAPDGHWPFRVDAQTGAELESYTSDVVTPARLMALLYERTGNPAYSHARDRAVRWLLENPICTHRWEGMYEDVGEQKAFSNLENWDVNEAIRYLTCFKETIPDAVATAETLNRFVEDQFVVWETGDPVTEVQVPCPSVMEQYFCYAPMEGHTAHWILSLIALHAATGNQEYLDKACAAADAICRSQLDTGSFTTWGYDLRFGRPLLDQYQWFGGEAQGVYGLLKLRAYLLDPKTPPLREF